EPEIEEAGHRANSLARRSTTPDHSAGYLHPSRSIVPRARDAEAPDRGVGRIIGGRETLRGTSRARAAARGEPPDRARRARRAGSLPPDPEPPTAALPPPRPRTGRRWPAGAACLPGTGCTCRTTRWR